MYFLASGYDGNDLWEIVVNARSKPHARGLVDLHLQAVGRLDLFPTAVVVKKKRAANHGEPWSVVHSNVRGEQAAIDNSYERLAVLLPATRVDLVWRASTR